MSVPSRLVALLVLLCSGCASTPRWPDWVMNPAQDSGPTAAECAPASGNISFDRSRAATLARASLAQTLEIKVQAMDEAYTEHVSREGGTQGTASFKATARTMVDKVLVNSRVIRTEEYRNPDGRWVCSMVAIGESEARAFAREVVRSSVATVSADTEDLLLTRFHAAAPPPKS